MGHTGLGAISDFIIGVFANRPVLIASCSAFFGSSEIETLPSHARAALAVPTQSGGPLANGWTAKLHGDGYTSGLKDALGIEVADMCRYFCNWRPLEARSV